ARIRFSQNWKATNLLFEMMYANCKRIKTFHLRSVSESGMGTTSCRCLVNWRSPALILHSGAEAIRSRLRMRLARYVFTAVKQTRSKNEHESGLALYHMRLRNSSKRAIMS